MRLGDEETAHEVGGKMRMDVTASQESDPGKETKPRKQKAVTVSLDPRQKAFGEGLLSGSEALHSDLFSLLPLCTLFLPIQLVWCSVFSLRVFL